MTFSAKRKHSSYCNKQAKEGGSEFIDVAYRAVFRRNADAAGLTEYVRFLNNGGSPTEVLNAFMRSTEFAQKQLLRQKTRYEELERFQTPDICRRSDSLKQSRTHSSVSFEPLAQSALDELSGKLGGQDEYLRFHFRRFLEIANVVAELRDESAPTGRCTILDVGFSVNSCILRKIFSDAEVSVCDRPQIDGSRKLGFETFAVDLTADNLDGISLGKRFDVIVFAEVLEHLLASPVRIMRFLLRHLSDDGTVLLTTPNFFRQSSQGSLANGRNPQPIYPEAYGRSEAPHFHVREYSLLELLELLTDAGGKVRAFYYSDCWDDPQLGAQLPPCDLGNIVITFGR